jgi:hypothetical protein
LIADCRLPIDQKEYPGLKTDQVETPEQSAIGNQKSAMIKPKG